jgi:hypothetical protein
VACVAWGAARIEGVAAWEAFAGQSKDHGFGLALVALPPAGQAFRVRTVLKAVARVA